MPIRKVGGGFKWGNHGHVYPNRAGAARQAAAAYAHGYTGMEQGGLVTKPLPDSRLPTPQVLPPFMQKRYF